MNDKDFDIRIREMVDSYSEIPGEDVWTGIQNGIMRKRRITLFRRIGYAASAAACLALGVVLFTQDKGFEPIKLAEISIAEPYVSHQVSSPRISRFTLPKAMPRLSDSEPAASVEKNAIARQMIPVQEVAVIEAAPEKNAIMDESINKAPESIQEQIAQNDYFASFEEPVQKGRRRPVSIGLTSNIIAANPGSSDFSIPQYAPGLGSSSNYGIVPLSEPNFSFPLSFGLQLQIPVIERLSIGTGVNYTFLHSKYQAFIDLPDSEKKQGLVDHDLHYLGVPVSLYYSIVQNEKIKFYVDAGGMVEKGLQSKCKIKDLYDNTEVYTDKISGVQWSVNAGLGFEYQFVNFLGLYLDPSITYFFDTDQPFSVRTSQPLQFKLEIGIRFHL